VDQVAESGSHSGGHVVKARNTSADDKPRFGKQPLYVDFTLDFVDGGFRDTESRAQPTPQGGGYQNLPSPAAKAFPFGSVGRPPESSADLIRRFLENAMSI
jgi:hypothetical protein